ncbi:hypothetical protein [Bacillus inaquosorum]|uniref:hypothetical protein n=1 Tax=Bacillus inaquosorum TaxID=483913 RepID=UPI00227E330F|nr:hypothetical protein [Bacillus inaquosorum]MCY9015075.1 hypothetical protein [Bacillus inaquosorum]
MSNSSKFAGQLIQNNIQINNLKASTSLTEKHMVDHEKKLTDTVNDFIEYQNYELKKHTENLSNPHQVTKTQLGLGNVLDVEQASKSEFNLHLNDTSNPHKVTKNQVGLSNVTNNLQATKEEFDLHTEDMIRHVTNTERNTWNSKETTDGSQTKADKALENAKAYTDTHVLNKSNPHGVTKTQIGLDKVDNVKQASLTDFENHKNDTTLHVTQTEKDRWDGAQLYKLTGDTGAHKLGFAGKDIYQELKSANTTTFYSNNTTVNNPNSASIRGIQIGQEGYGEVFGMANDGTTWRNTYALDIWKGWRRLLDTADISPTWNIVTLINGAKQDSTYPFKFSISCNILWLRGSFGTLPSIGTSIAKFSNKPTQLIDFIVPTIGSYGTAKFTFTTDGDIRFDGMSTTDNTSVTRVSFNIGIPLW